MRRLALRADERERLRAALPQDLQEGRPDSPGRRRHDDPVAGRDTCARAHAYQAVRKTTGTAAASTRSTPSGSGKTRGFGNDDLLGVASEDRHAHHRASGRETGHARPDRLDRPRHLHPRHERGLRRARVVARSHEEVGEVQPDRGGPDQHLARTGNRVGPRAEHQTLRAPAAIHEPGARGRHRERLSADLRPTIRGPAGGDPTQRVAETSKSGLTPMPIALRTSASSRPGTCSRRS